MFSMYNVYVLTKQVFKYVNIRCLVSLVQAMLSLGIDGAYNNV
jgi:hypothetical protein